MFELAQSLSGTLTGEHGVGLLKKDWFTAEVGKISRDLQHRIKQALDPNNIFNPRQGHLSPVPRDFCAPDRPRPRGLQVPQRLLGASVLLPSQYIACLGQGVFDERAL